MNNFENSLREGYAKKVEVNTLRAQSLFKSSGEAIAAARSIHFEYKN